MSKKIYNCPCDTCVSRSHCGKKELECKAVKHYYHTGWYDKKDIMLKLKPIRWRTA